MLSRLIQWQPLPSRIPETLSKRLFPPLGFGLETIGPPAAFQPGAFAVRPPVTGSAAFRHLDGMNQVRLLHLPRCDPQSPGSFFHLRHRHSLGHNRCRHHHLSPKYCLIRLHHIRRSFLALANTPASQGVYSIYIFGQLPAPAQMTLCKTPDGRRNSPGLTYGKPQDRRRPRFPQPAPRRHPISFIARFRLFSRALQTKSASLFS